MTYAQAKIIFRTVSIVVYSLLFMSVFRFITIMFSNFFSLLRPFTLFYYTVHGRCVFFCHFDNIYTANKIYTSILSLAVMRAVD